MTIKVRRMLKEDAMIISEAFKKQGWRKSKSLYDYYFNEQEKGSRIILVALKDEEFAGYLTIMWESHYNGFREKQIPEINDLNILIASRKQGIATTLMDEAEQIIKKQSHVAGLGFGVTKDYGNAMRMYIKRGYIPDGNGLVKDNKCIGYGEQVTVDDDLCMFLTKEFE